MWFHNSLVFMPVAPSPQTPKKTGLADAPRASLFMILSVAISPVKKKVANTKALVVLVLLHVSK